MTETSRIRTIGRYHLLDEIGRGGMAIVYKGFDPIIGRTVALKTIAFGGGDSAERELRQRLYREACAAGTLQHPNVVTVYDVIEEGGTTAVAMEFVQGQTLAAVIAEQAPMPFDSALDLFGQICAAIDYAGQHDIVHRDIKPANILVTPDGRVKVADFGVARMAVSTTTQTGTVLGSPSYMSPEQIKALPLDARSDLFAAAVVFYELLTRERPFAGDDVATTMFRIVHEPPTPPAHFNAAIGPELSAVFARALAKDRDERYRTGAELCAELRRATSMEQVLVREPIVAPVRAAGGSTLIRNTLIGVGVIVLLLVMLKVKGTGGSGEGAVSSAAPPAQPAPVAVVQPPAPPPAAPPVTAPPIAAPPLADGPVSATSLPPVGVPPPVPSPPVSAPVSAVPPPEAPARTRKAEPAARGEGADRDTAPAAGQATVQVTYEGDVYPVSVFSGQRSVGRLAGSGDRLPIGAGRATLRVVSESLYLDRAFGTFTLAAGERRTLSLPGIVSAFIGVKGDTYEGLRILIDGRAVTGSYPAQLPRLAGGPHRVVFRWSTGALEGVELVGQIELTNGRHFLIRAEPDADRVVVQKLR